MTKKDILEKHYPNCVYIDGHDLGNIHEAMEEYHQTKVKENELLHSVSVSDWISVKDQLPQDLKGVLVYIENQDHIAQGCIEKGIWREVYSDDIIECGETDKGVTHWKKLPSTPHSR